jgi:hypothetical protein
VRARGRKLEQATITPAESIVVIMNRVARDM